MTLDESLAAVEQLIEKVSAALLAAEPASLEKHSIALRAAAAHFSYALEHHSARGLPIAAPMKKRMAAISNMLMVHRENLARLSAATDRQATGLLPPSAAVTTYGDSLGVRSAHPGVARIYRSAG